MIPVHVHGVALLPPHETPVMLLREISGARRWLPISIGSPEAVALVAACEQLANARPDTVELIGQVLAAFGRQVQCVEVTALDADVFFAELVLDNGLRVSARPSDAVAIGVRADAPLQVAESVLATAATELKVVEDDPEQQIAEFRGQLDEVTPEDFEGPPSG
ncbi:bifunctional nuclease family protein [Amycolatopsis sp. 195334CR]|uniref:bifunctional nuclease family protein n=1 Tax=Amycolatopsis sp. 195334CR TaxID=2814588 RepID=UPI001A8DC72E|nr:bifunctional nuclease family protein [Amycolatopsis sp. 195334CR]MBN6038395.1 bifunctional nuclease family protein [Amycolatopsis sp. 195334CR]